MGTNYYARTNMCKCCGRYDELHIGKSSIGWTFSLHVYPDIVINSLEDWKELMEKSTIVDEYGEEITFSKMLDIITNRKFDGVDITEYVLKKNNAIMGPNGLLRHELSDRCIGHGEGTWDLMVGYFS